MKIGLAVLLFGAAFSADLAFAQPTQANAMMLAQAHDRCMTSYAVRMTKTEATDEQIFSGATEGCKELQGQFHAAVVKEYPAAQADELITMLNAQAKPNFLNMLRKIRSDRLLRSGN